MYESILLCNSPDANLHFLKRYIRLINIWKNQKLSGYTEKHHILPKHMFPDYKNFKLHPWNLIKLTARQHILAHYILMKAYPKSWKLAISVLRTYGQYHTINAQNTRIVAESRIQSSIRKKGIKRAPLSNVTREKLSAIKRQFYANPENRLKQSEACKGSTGRVGNYPKTKSSAHCKQISQTLSGRKRGPQKTEHSKKISLALKGKPKSAEHLKNLSQSLQNQHKYMCPHCNTMATAANVKRWHGDNCRYIISQI